MKKKEKCYDPCNPCICQGDACEKCMFGGGKTKEEQEAMLKKVLEENSYAGIIKEYERHHDRKKMRQRKHRFRIETFAQLYADFGGPLFIPVVGLFVLAIVYFILDGWLSMFKILPFLLFFLVFWGWPFLCYLLNEKYEKEEREGKRTKFRWLV